MKYLQAIVADGERRKLKKNKTIEHQEVAQHVHRQRHPHKVIS